MAENNTQKQFLDSEGLNALWNKICSIFASKDELEEALQSFYEVTVDLSNTSVGESYTENISATTHNVSAFNVGDKIRIKSNLDFPTGQNPTQAAVWAPGFDITSYILSPDDAPEIIQNIGVLRWPTVNDIDSLNSLYLTYNTEYAYPNQQLLKYGGYIDVMIVDIKSSININSGVKTVEYICISLFNNSCGYISTSVVNATNATNIDINTPYLNLNNSYPLVFTDDVNFGLKKLYTDSENNLYYNPSTNALTVPTLYTTAINHTDGSTIEFGNSVSLTDSSCGKGTFNIKGNNHDFESIKMYGGSTIAAPYIHIGKAAAAASGEVGIKMIGMTTRNTSNSQIILYGLNSSTAVNTTITAGSAPTTSSDERLKDFLDDIPIDFNDLKQLPKKYFVWKDDNEDDLHIGTSAQAVEKIYPDLVKTDENGYKSLEYAKLSIIALAAIDKLNDRITSLENDVRHLLDANEKLIQQLNK